MNPSDTPLVSVVIISYNTAQMTQDCLKALYEDLGDIPAEVFVVDNASTDGSPAAVRAAYPQVQVIENSRNAGFGAANNQAMEAAQGRYFLLLNSDAFPKPGAMRAMLAVMEREPKAAVVGPRLLNADGSLQRSCFKFPSPMRAWLENLWLSAAFAKHPVLGDYRRWAHDTERTVDSVIGACMLVRREVYEEVGGFDDGFFMYSEETDWQKRMADRGWKVVFTPDAQVTHLGGASGAGEKAKINRYFFESLDYYERKHHGLPGLISLRAAMTLGSFLRALLWLGVTVVSPRRRAVALSKVRLSSWLCVRQATCWRPALKGGRS